MPKETPERPAGGDQPTAQQQPAPQEARRPRAARAEEPAAGAPAKAAATKFALAAFAKEFIAANPAAADAGIYTAVTGDRYHGQVYEVEDGRHPVTIEGKPWLFRFKDKAFKEAGRAEQYER